MQDIIKFTVQTTDNGSNGILASELYKYLCPNSRDYNRWVDRNIARNQYLVKNVDYVEVAEAQISGSADTAHRRKLGKMQTRKKNYILCIDAAKKLCLSTKTPRQQEIIDAITKFVSRATKEPMIPVSKISAMIEIMVADALSKQSGRVSNYDTVLLENKQKDETIKSLQVQKIATGHASDNQGLIRQIVNIIVRETPYYADKKDAHQIIYNMIMSKFFVRSPVKWKATWYALKDKAFAKDEFKRVKESTGEMPASKLDWIRLTHPGALNEICEVARDVAVQNLPYTFFQNGGKLPV